MCHLEVDSAGVPNSISRLLPILSIKDSLLREMLVQLLQDIGIEEWLL